MDDRIKDLKNALSKTLGIKGDDDLIVNILTTLDKQKFLRYHNEQTVNLISTPGRVLCALIEDSTMTQRALSVYLNLSETMIDKTIKSLIDAGLITKTKVNRKNSYKYLSKNIIKHPDIQHLLQSINSLELEEYPKKRVEKEELF